MSIESEIYARLSGGLVTTPFYIELLDVAGKKATGYLAGVGAGETLRSETITGWSNAAVALYDVFTSSGKDITSAIQAAGVGATYSDLVSYAQNALFKIVNDVTINSGNFPELYFGYGEPNIQPVPDFATIGPQTAGLHTYYYINPSTWNILQYNGVGPCDFSSLNSLKRVTDPPATAVHIVSSLNGTTRNWASIESGFDPNTIASWKIYDLATPGFYLPGVGIFNRGDFTVGNAFFWSSIDLSPYAGKLITAATGLSALVGDRIYPQTIPDKQPLPAMTYSIISNVPEHAMGADADIETIRLQVSCWADDYDLAKAIEVQVRAALSRYRGGNIKDCFFDNSLDLYDGDEDIYHIAIDFIVFFKA